MKWGCSQELLGGYGQELFVERSSGSRTQAHSCPLGGAGADGTGAGATGERVQWGPEQGACFFTGIIGGIGAVFADDTTTA